MAQKPNPSVRYFARVRHRADERLFGIKTDDRMSHIYVVGKTGTGKTTLLETMLAGDLGAGVGCALLDPHGDLATRVFSDATRKQKRRIVYVDPASPKASFSYNPLTHTSLPLRPLVAAGLLDVFKMMWSDAWGSRMEHVLRNALLALLDQPSAHLPDILALISDDAFRAKAVPNIQNLQVRRYWEHEFPNYAKRYRGDAIAPIQSKVGALLADPRLHRFFTADKNQLRLRHVMDEGQVLIINLSKGRLGSDSSALLGGVLTTMLGVAAFSRVADAEKDRRRFFIYIDEFQTFTTLAIAEMMAELRKTGVALILAHQFLSQVSLPIRHSVLGNAGTLISFRVGAEDAAYLAKEFEPKFQRLDLINLANYQVYLRLMIDGAPSRPFSAATVLPQEIRRRNRACSNLYRLA
jgi:hypothetical protein